MRIVEQNEKRMVIADEHSLFKLIKLLVIAAFVTGVVAVILIFAELDSEMFFYLFFHYTNLSTGVFCIWISKSSYSPHNCY